MSGAADGVEVTPLFGAARGCSTFEQRLLRFSGPSAGRSDAASDEVLYVLEGRAEAVVDGRRHGLEPGVACYLPRGTTWSIGETTGTGLLSVVVPDPPEGESRPAVVSRTSRSRATAGRAFELLACPDIGCRSVTQFIGLVPPGRAPDHFHTYDEVIYILEGEGALEIDGEAAPLRAGSCIHLPARLVHCLANTGDTELRLLGVFRPAGSPAEAYYPDGTAAVVPGSED
ncbi:MAG TPA: cupin domain-containing protein [Gaiellaceae bacterium]|nr:cupin domain-containing protein [Gaiellaceae bacterium]